MKPIHPGYLSKQTSEKAEKSEKTEFGDLEFPKPRERRLYGGSDSDPTNARLCLLLFTNFRESREIRESRGFSQ